MNIKTGLTAVFEQVGDDYIGYIEEMPGVNTQGATIKEAKANLQEALELILEVRREIEPTVEKGLSLSDFSFTKSRKITEGYKGSFSNTLIEERRSQL